MHDTFRNHSDRIVTRTNYLEWLEWLGRPGR
jgi:hypothetical protein